MNVVEFIKKESDQPVTRVVVMAAVAGLAQALVLTIINSASKKISADEESTRQLVMFAIVIILYVVAQKFNMMNGMAFIENILHGIRTRLADKVRRADLLKLEQIGAPQIYNRLTQEAAVISQFSLPIVSALQSAAMLVIVLGYIFTLSVVAFVIVVIFNITAVWIYLKRDKLLAPLLVQINRTEIEFFKSLTDMLAGMKEVKLRKSRSESLAGFIKSISVELKSIKDNIGGKYAENIIFPQTAYMILMGAVVFILPRYSTDYKDVVTDVTVSILFMFGPVGTLVGLMPLLDKVKMAIGYIYELEAELDKSVELTEKEYATAPVTSNGFKKIVFKDITFRYPDTDGKGAFAVGPVNLTINAGETVFLVGGNGCGKTTLLKLITMLYFPEKGSVSVDGREIARPDILMYREMFSAVFADFHLFTKLYGLEESDPAKVDALLQYMRLEKKTQLQEGRFTDIDLSTGQRKRLAMVVALLENRSICIFDEWAADQDPEFRKIFYEEILKDLKKRKKTVIAVSHDDRYYKYADRVIRMDYGMIENEGAKKKGR